MSLTVKLVVKDQKDALEYIDVHDGAVLSDIKHRLLHFIDFGCDVFWCKPDEGEEIPMTFEVENLTVEVTSMIGLGFAYEGEGIEFTYGNIKYRDKLLSHFDAVIATSEDLARARKRLAGRKRWVRVVGRFFEYEPDWLIRTIHTAVKKAKPWDMTVGSKTKIDDVNVAVHERHCLEFEGFAVCVTKAKATYSSDVATVFTMTIQPSKYGMHIEDTVQPITA